MLCLHIAQTGDGASAEGSNGLLSNPTTGVDAAWPLIALGRALLCRSEILIEISHILLEVLTFLS